MENRKAIVHRGLGIALLPLGGETYPGRFALIDAPLAPLFQMFRWYPKANGDRRALYAATRIPGTNVHLRMHSMMLGSDDGIPDHINGNTLDNRLCNLRACSQKHNAWSQQKHRHGTSRFKGVYLQSGRTTWRARIRVDGKFLHLGMFRSEEEAARAYDKAALEHFGSYARLNFPKTGH